MNPDVKARWVAALRSGEYQQATDQLRRVNGNDVGFCCLGVLCDISGLSSWSGARAYDNEGLGGLPKSVMAWAGLDHCNPLVKVGRAQWSLAELNDGEPNGDPWTFEQIADVIEAQL